ncbi:MAG: phosphoribosylanthranilate isomerase [Candidatus Omnitrophica bacterium]|nr:phosphoribosylanthranilate isomerase [Candidatus Omnitrophota bacterium]
MVKVKICGITNVKDARAAVQAGADAVGFIFYKKSQRYISPSKAKRIIETLPPFVSKVGVFVDEKAGSLRDIIDFCGLDTIQLHGDEDHHTCHRYKRYGVKIIKAFRVKENFNLKILRPFKVDAYLFDAYVKDIPGGTGETFSWNILEDIQVRVPFILSGGLHSGNVQKAIRMVRPYAVDVSSGVEKEPGKKDHGQVRVFLKMARSVDQ